MTHLSFILTAWIGSTVAIAAYCVRLVQRGRHLAKAVPSERRRWMTTESTDATTRR